MFHGICKYFPPLQVNFYQKKNKAEIYFSICRSMLSAVESTATQHLRLTLARQLAEVLLRGCSEHAYKAPNQGMRKLGGQIFILSCTVSVLFLLYLGILLCQLPVGCQKYTNNSFKQNRLQIIFIVDAECSPNVVDIKSLL